MDHRMPIFGLGSKSAPGVKEARNTLHKNLEFTALEQYKLIRANLDFTLPENEKCPIIGVTSSMRGEGKSTTAVNLAYVFAEKGSKVLLIDGDLRIPSIAKKLQISSTPGLADLLRGKSKEFFGFQRYLLDNWFVLPSGDIPPNPSELLGSGRMENVLNQMKEHFDCIIVDLPPVNLVSDAVSISRLISGMIVVIREEYTEKKELEKCFRQLKLSNVNVLGCVMNEAKSGNGNYGRYRKYRSYKHYHSYQTYQSEEQAVE
ncbi:MAG: CpsD/CapB family tyrosine-protein kinase [Clostridia bacterium]|nr:CpsD/CapB family tyrosine-protein kinase [Clostridia bacterium]